MNLIRQPFVFAALWLCCLAGPLAAQTARPQRPQPERWLLIVDTSSAMKSRAAAVQGVVGELLASGMNGEMKLGAELGVWTYGKELYAGVLPKQTWVPGNSNLMVSRTVGFLAMQEYRGKAQLQPVLEGMSHAARVSQRLTVVWISDGSQKISGTPFDEAINTAFATNKSALAKSRMPIVTVLRTHYAACIGQSVSVAPWPVEFPPFPVDPEKTNTMTKVAMAPSKTIETVKPLFMSGANKTTDAPAPSIKLRPPPDAAATEVVIPPAKPVETVQPLPLVDAPSAAPVAAPVVAPVEPVPVVKPAPRAPEPKAVELAAAQPPPVVPPASTPAPAPAPASAPKVSSSAPVAPEPQVALVTETVTARKWPLILGIGFMWVAIVAALLLARRARRANSTSLITRSLNQQK